MAPETLAVAARSSSQPLGVPVREQQHLAGVVSCVSFQPAQQHCCSHLRPLARNQCRCRDHRGRPGQQAQLDQQDRKARRAHKARLEWRDLWGRKENQATLARLVPLVPKERSDQRAAVVKAVLLGLVEKLVRRAPSAPPALKGSKAS